MEPIKTTSEHKAPFKSYTEKRIELGQDVNNTWAIVAARLTRDSVNPGLNEIETVFEATFKMVRRASENARNSVDLSVVPQ